MAVLPIPTIVPVDVKKVFARLIIGDSEERDGFLDEIVDNGMSKTKFNIRAKEYYKKWFIRANTASIFAMVQRFGWDPIGITLQDIEDTRQQYITDLTPTPE